MPGLRSGANNGRASADAATSASGGRAVTGRLIAGRGGGSTGAGTVGAPSANAAARPRAPPAGPGQKRRTRHVMRY